MDIAQVKNLPKLKRNQVLRKVKVIEGVTQRQAARILSVSLTLIEKHGEVRKENRPLLSSK